MFRNKKGLDGRIGRKSETFSQQLYLFGFVKGEAFLDATQNVEKGMLRKEKC